jgi:hypothetical protein
VRHQLGQRNMSGGEAPRVQPRAAVVPPGGLSESLVSGAVSGSPGSAAAATASSGGGGGGGSGGGGVGGVGGLGSAHSNSVIGLDRSERAITLAIVGNCAIFALKLWAWYVTRSTAMFAEAVHTLADVGNQVPLAGATTHVPVSA